MTVIDFLRDARQELPLLGTMLAKDTVARRLNSEEGISLPNSATRCCRATTSSTCLTNTTARWNSAAPTSGRATSPPAWT